NHLLQLPVERLEPITQFFDQASDLCNVNRHGVSHSAVLLRCASSYNAGSFVDIRRPNRQDGFMKRISLERFGQIVARVMKTLPAEFQPYLDNIVVDVEEEPDVEALRQLGFTEEEIAEGESLYGLFAPIDLPTPWGGDVIDVRDLPHRIIIYKRP